MEAREANHHVDERNEPSAADFGPAVLDKYAVGLAVDYGERYRDLGYLAIRGREQQLIDSHGAEQAQSRGVTPFVGGAWSDTPSPRLTENAERGVAKDNPVGEIFHAASDLLFGSLAPFTGNRISR
jgi:hypothetical protein